MTTDNKKPPEAVEKLWLESWEFHKENNKPHGNAGLYYSDNREYFKSGFKAAYSALKAECEKFKRKELENIRVLQELTGSNNIENPWLGIAAATSLMKSENADLRAALEEIETVEKIAHKRTGLATVPARIARNTLAKYKKETKE